MRADVEIAPTATTQEHKRNSASPSATQLITAHNAVKAKPRHGRGHCALIGAASASGSHLRALSHRRTRNFQSMRRAILQLVK